MEKTRRAEPTTKGELTDAISIDTSAIPECVRVRLAAATLDFVKEILRQPGGREMLDARKAAQAAK